MVSTMQSANPEVVTGVLFACLRLHFAIHRELQRAQFLSGAGQAKRSRSEDHTLSRPKARRWLRADSKAAPSSHARSKSRHLADQRYVYCWVVSPLFVRYSPPCDADIDVGRPLFPCRSSERSSMALRAVQPSVLVCFLEFAWSSLDSRSAIRVCKSGTFRIILRSLIGLI